jgi:hypothetical protein
MIVPSELSHVVDAGCSRGVGQPKGRPPFYSTSASIIASLQEDLPFYPDDSLSQQ